MTNEILSVAIFEPLPGMEKQCLATVRELLAILSVKGYSRDRLYHYDKDSNHFMLVRYWASEESRREAQEDPAAQKCWARLGHLMTIIRVYEALEEVPL